jgi:hypothetical protein
LENQNTSSLKVISDWLKLLNQSNEMKKLLTMKLSNQHVVLKTFKTKSNSKYKKKERIQNEFLKETPTESSTFDLGPIDENESAKQSYLNSNFKFEKGLFNEFFGFDSHMNPIEKKKTKRVVENQIEFFNQIDQQGIKEDKDEKVNNILKNYQKIKESDSPENVDNIISIFISRDKFNEERKLKWNQGGYEVLNVIPWLDDTNQCTIQLVKKNLKKEEEKKDALVMDVKLKIKELMKKNSKKSNEMLKKLLKEEDAVEDKVEEDKVEEEDKVVVDMLEQEITTPSNDSFTDVEFKKYKMNHGNTRIPSSLEDKINALIKEHPKSMIRESSNHLSATFRIRTGGYGNNFNFKHIQDMEPHSKKEEQMNIIE